MSKKINAIILTMMAVLILPACSYSQMNVVSDIEESFDGVEAIVVNGRFLEVSYEGSPRATEVFLSAYLESNGEGGPEIIYKRDGNLLKVEVTPSNGGWGNYRNSGYISLVGPETVRLDLNTSSGRVEVSNVLHDEIKLKASSGKINLNNIQANEIQFSASSGSISGSNLIGQVKGKVSSGKISLNGVEGSVDVTSSSGRIELNQIEGVAHCNASSGSISLEQVEELGKIKVSSGSVKAINSGLGANTDLHGSSGSFRINTFSNLSDLNFRLNASSGGLTVGQSKGRKSLVINNGSDITVRGNTSSGSIRIEN
ncbi:DUF4097 family beta strand repeat-containing protein [Pararhodonellum marinum]|uniref:DUF4097 family beta strand repeat-containing protein n=1 Tax=Pararhodonellum marinum TaxID=2755358 RepID=UPI00188EF74D|nr:DUF4097 family beta strand repeat-containing protein [Pararhodonellum marinum]